MRENTTRRVFLRTVFGGLATALLRPCPFLRAAPMQKSPLNFVFFLIDDFGWMDFGANNPHCFYETPNIDRLARLGTNFTDGYAANPVCSPTRYSIMTGKYPSRVDATNWFSGKRSGRFNPAPLNATSRTYFSRGPEGAWLQNGVHRQVASGQRGEILA